MTTHQARSEELKARLAARAAQIFNTAHPIGSRLMHIPRPGAKPGWARTTSEAFEMAGRSMVYVAHRLDPVETDALYPAPPALNNPGQDYLTARGRTLRAVLLFAAGFASAVALAYIIPPAKAVPPEALIMMDCDAIPPGDAAPEASDGRAQA